MKICHIAINNIFLPPYEGGGVHEVEIAKNLSLLGNEVHMFIDRRNEYENKIETINGINVKRLDVYRFKRKLFKGKRGTGSVVIKTGDFKQKMKVIGVKILGILLGLFSMPFIIKTAKNCDIIYERSSSFGAGTFVSLILRKPIVIEVVDTQKCGFLLKFADGIITHFDNLIPKYINRSNILVMENATDHEKFNPQVNSIKIRKKYGLERKLVLTYTGGFHPWHALDKIVIAAKKIVNEFSNVKFLMVGDGPEKENIIKMVDDIGLGKNFIFPGKVPYNQIPEFLAASDVLISLYTDKMYFNSTITTKLCEYMSMGKPVVAYGIKEGLIRHRENGILIKPTEDLDKKLVEYCIQLLRNKKMRGNLGKKAWMVVCKISWKDKAKLTNDMFKKLLV
jgi:glycosyltransferase involved in cell wall biosynthesis